MPAHGLGHRHVLERLVRSVDDAIHPGGHLVGLDLAWCSATFLVFDHQAGAGADALQLIHGHVREGVFFHDPAAVGCCVDHMHVLAHRLVQCFLRPHGVIHHPTCLATAEVGKVRHHGEMLIRAVTIEESGRQRGNRPLHPAPHALGTHSALGQGIRNRVLCHVRLSANVPGCWPDDAGCRLVDEALAVDDAVAL